MGTVIYLAEFETPDHEIAIRLEGVLSMIMAIEEGELLAALPDCEQAQGRHLTALGLLSVVRREIEGVQAHLRQAPTADLSK